MAVFSNTQKLEIANVAGNGHKITDIAFAKNGRMLVAERGGPHSAQVHEYILFSNQWMHHQKLTIGKNSGNNAAGGVDYGYKELNGDIRYGCDSIIWATGNYMDPTLSSHLVYGMMGIEATGNSTSSTAHE